MSATADNKPVANSEEDDIFGPPENYPVLSSSESWHESEDPSSQSTDEEITENARECGQIKSEDEDSRSETEQKKGRQRRVFAKSKLAHGKIIHDSKQAYKTLLKDMYDDPDSRTWNKQQNVTLSTVGLVQWTGKENDTFFTALARKGRGNVSEIAQQIKSKSRLEVAEYIEFLEERLQRHQFSGPSLLEAEVPAAVEISTELEAVLDKFAKNIALEEQRRDLLKARKEHGSAEFWILDKAKADQVDELLTSADKEEEALPEAISPSASLLDLKNFIQLSERIFMNTGKSRPEDNWKNVAQKGETPSLTADALGEFYDLTVDLVIRLMEEAHNTAMERLDKGRRERLSFVRRKDVKRALTIMGLKHNTFEYYVNLPRRLEIDVTKAKCRGKAKSYLSYDKVEQMLSKKRRIDTKEISDTSDDSSEADTENDAKADDEGDNDEEDELDEFGSSEDWSETQSQDDQSELEEVSNADEDNDLVTPKSRTIVEYQEMSDSEYESLELEKRLDEYNVYLDQQASHKEEVRIRELLGYPALDKEQEEKPPMITEEMRREIMQNNAVIDWRKNLVYQDEWETYGKKTRDVERDVEINRNKRRRIE